MMKRALWVGLLCLIVSQAPEGLKGQVEVSVRVVDGSTGEGVYGARVLGPDGSPIGISGVQGTVLLTVDTLTHVTIDALGYEAQSVELDPGNKAGVAVALVPRPVELEGLVVSGTRFSQRLKTRRNATRQWSDVLSETVLLNAPDPTLEDLLRSRFAIEFRDFTDFGCRLVRRLGETQIAHFYIDERPVSAGIFEALSPKAIGMLEVFGIGPIGGDLRVFAYTRDYVSEMSARGAPPTPLATTPTLC